MDIQSIINNFATTPFLFIGSGFSKRYCNLPDWNQLLKTFTQRLSSDEFAYNSYKSRARMLTSTDEENLPLVASLIMKDFDERWFSDPSFRTLSE